MKFDVSERISILRSTGGSREHAPPNQITFDLLERFLHTSTHDVHPLVTFDNDGNAVIEYHDPTISVTFYEDAQIELYRIGGTPSDYQVGVFTPTEIDNFLNGI